MNAAQQLTLGAARETSALFPRKLCDGAGFSSDRKHRYWLSRRIAQTDRWNHAFLWLMLNPSTADETNLDPTLRRCMAFTKAWGGTQMLVGNIFSIVSSDPKVLLTDPNPVGPLCDENLRAMAQWCCWRVVVGWGAFTAAKKRADEVVRMLTPECKWSLHCLGKNLDGSPKHPLYLASDTKLMPFEEDQHAQQPVQQPPSRP